MAVARTRVRVKSTGQIIPQYQKRESAYDGGSMGRRAQSFMPQGGSISRLTVGTLQMQRNRSRDLVRKVPWIASAVESYGANLIGTGIVPNSQVEDPALKAEIKDLFLEFSDEIDADGLTDFYGMLEMAVKAVPPDGEMFFRIRPRKLSDGLAVPFQLQALEADFVPIDKNEQLPNGYKIVMGIEFDRMNRRVAYHMHREHPGDILTSSSSWDTVRVPADRVIHFFIPQRVGQVRGIPGLAPVVMRVRDLLEYEDAELVRKKTAAMFTAFIQKNNLDDNMLNEGASMFDEEDDEDGVGITSLEPGTVQILEQGEEIKFSSPADVGGNYEVFLKMQLRAIAAGIGVTYEQMTGDLKDVNYTSIRAGLLEFQRRAKQKQKVVIFQICRRVWIEFMRSAVLSGAIKIPNYAFNPRPFNKALWVPQGWRYVNPRDDVAATVAMIRAGLMSRSKAVSELGEDIGEVDRQLAADNVTADGLGLVLTSDPRNTTDAGLVADRSEEGKGE